MLGLVLAAGEGSRMGGPKACLRWGGDTLLAAQLRAALAAGCSRAVAVVREPVARQVAGGVAALPGATELVISQVEPSLGPAGSIAAFVAQAGELTGQELVAISPVDVLPQAWTVLPALLRALEATGAAMGARPVHRGRGGHPVLVSAAVLEAYGRGSPPMPLREVLRALGAAVLDVEVQTAAVVIDLDTPEDFARFAPVG